LCNIFIRPQITLSGARIARAGICEVGEHWAAQCFLYEKFDEYDNAVMCMINHVAEAFDHRQFTELLSKGNNIEICHKAIDFYIEYSPMELNDMLVFLVSRLDHIRVVNQISRTSNCPSLPGRVSGLGVLHRLSMVLLYGRAWR
jgi:clathrin heavy chain